MSLQRLGQPLIALALFALLGLLIWKNYLAPQQQTAVTPPAFDQQFTDFTARQFRQNGLLSWTVSGAELRHLTKKKGYQFSQVECLLESKDNNTPPWLLTAPSGGANDRLTVVKLTGGVQGHRAANGALGALVFGTQTMTILPQQQQASSAVSTHLAEMNRPGKAPQAKTRWTSDSSSFNLNYDTQVFQQTDVRDHYNPPKPPAKTPANSPDNNQGARP